MATETSGTTHTHHNGAAIAAHKPKRKSRRHSASATQKVASRLADVLTIDHLTDAAEGITEQLSELKDKTMETAEAMEEKILKHPKSSVLIAFGIGYVYARLRRWF